MSDFEEYANARVQAVEFDAKLRRLKDELARLEKAARSNKEAFWFWEQKIAPLEKKTLSFHRSREECSFASREEKLAAFQTAKDAYNAAQTEFLNRFGFDHGSKAGSQMLNLINIHIPRIRYAIERCCHINRASCERI